MEAIVMTIATDQVSLPLDKPDVDNRPGSSDVTWAERAYYHDQPKPASERRRGHYADRHRLRMLVAALVVLFLMAGLIVVLRYQGSAPAPVTRPPTSSQTVTAPRTAIARSPFTLTPPMGTAFRSLFPTINLPER
jgi:hypothetical protein